MNRFHFVADHQHAFEVKRLCQAVEVSRSSFYAWCAAAPARAERVVADAELAERIRTVQDPKTGGDPAYGAPRVTAELNDGVPAEDRVITGESRTAQRVAFGQLIETGMLSPGATLTDRQRRHKARVRADGSLALECGQQKGRAGSIHQLGAAVQGLPSCNGWTFWHVETASKLVPLDHMREAYRTRLSA